MTAAFSERAAQVLPPRRFRGSVSGPLRRLEEVRTMLAETVHEWTAAWVEHGREQGQRELLCHQAARKFDAATAERLAAALEGVADSDRLTQIGDWIIECETAADLFARFVEQGREQGREQGLQQGRAQGQRVLLRHLVSKKFGDAAAQRLGAALEGVADPDRLTRIGDWIIECETADELFARFQDD